MPRFGFDKVREPLGDFSARVGRSDGFDTLPDFFDRRTMVIFAKVQMQSAGCDESGDVRSIAVLLPARNEIGEAVKVRGTAEPLIRRDGCGSLDVAKQEGDPIEEKDDGTDGEYGVGDGRSDDEQAGGDGIFEFPIVRNTEDSDVQE